MNLTFTFSTIIIYESYLFYDNQLWPLGSTAARRSSTPATAILIQVSIAAWTSSCSTTTTMSRYNSCGYLSLPSSHTCCSWTSFWLPQLSRAMPRLQRRRMRYSRCWSWQVISFRFIYVIFHVLSNLLLIYICKLTYESDSLPGGFGGVPKRVRCHQWQNRQIRSCFWDIHGKFLTHRNE